MPLTPRQRRFVEAYAGNAAEAARAAGYSEKTANRAGSRLLSDVDVRAAIAAREQKSSAGRIATREERQAFWTNVLNNPEVEWQARLKASELLGKSNADFTERHLHEGKVTLEQLVVGSYEGEK